jgi:hypothetical protein
MIAGRIGVLSLAAGWLMSGVAYGQANQPFFVPGNLVVAGSSRTATRIWRNSPRRSPTPPGLIPLLFSVR